MASLVGAHSLAHEPRGLEVAGLYDERREEITQLAAAVSEAMGGADAVALLEEDDLLPDLFFLRYLLSFKSVDKAVAPLKSALEWRQENREKLKLIKDGGDEPHHDTMARFQCTGWCGAFFGGPVFVVRTSHSDTRGLMNTLTPEQVTESMTIQKEQAYRACERATRESGFITKMTTVIDLEGFRLLDGDRRFFKCLGASSKQSSMYYPQLLGKTVIVNAPSYFSLLYKAFSIFQPKSALDKMRLCPGQKTWTKDAAATCPFIKRMNGGAAIPPFLGGTMEVPPYLTPRAERADALAKVTVSARDKVVIESEIPVAGCSVRWEVLLDDRGIEMSAHLLPTGAEDGGDSVAPVDVMDAVKIKAENGLTTGVMRIPSPGNLKIVFDNSYSILRSKSLQYRIDIDLPEEGGGGGEGGEAKAD